MTDPIEQFREALVRRGIIVPDEIIADGRIHRCNADGKNGSGDAAYLLHLDGVPAGGFQNWRDGQGWEDWHANIDRPLSSAEQARHRQRIEATKRERESEEAKRRTEARGRAARILGESKPARADHPYLKAKGVQAHGLSQHGDALVIPVRDASGELHSLQFIDADSTKQFLKGGMLRGCFFGIGEPNGTVCIAEGYATAASIFEATDHAVAVAFNAANMEPVAISVRTQFPDARLVLCADNDIHPDGKPNTGVIAAERAARAVGGLVAVPVLDGVKCDFNDLAQRAGAEAVQRTISAATAPPDHPTPANQAASALPAAESGGWPAPLDEAAFYGLAGDIVRAIEPHSEADGAALLLQTLVAFGALVGRGAHVRVEGDEHHAQLYLLLVGQTAKARKGTSWGRIHRLFSRVPDWPKVVEGLSSGEGLKWAVRDPREDREPGNQPAAEMDVGIPDKRLLVVESEFAQVLRQTARAGNTLSATIRSAWDTGQLATLTKNDPVTATGTHISIVGHITMDELRAELTATDTANGFANRFLFMCVRRSKCLPLGGNGPPEAVAADLARRIALAADSARKLQAVGMTPAARETWTRIYPKLSEGTSGLLGAVTARGEAQCLRLALLYALLDGAENVDDVHLVAAIAVWERAEASAMHIFGSAIGDRLADAILRALRAAGQAGLSRTDIRNLLGRHGRAERIEAALELLSRHGLAYAEQHQTGGRAAEVWRCR